jgi:hypothetical protein
MSLRLAGVDIFTYALCFGLQVYRYRRKSLTSLQSLVPQWQHGPTARKIVPHAGSNIATKRHQQPNHRGALPKDGHARISRTKYTSLRLNLY